jgi:ribonucleotide monophosphatase NagD (HAD superfamily)
VLCLGDEPLVDAAPVIGAMLELASVVVTTNDSRRGPAEQRSRVVRAGVPTSVPIVAAADAVVERLASLGCGRVAVVGTDGLRAHLEARGVTVVGQRTQRYDAVVTGCVPDPDVLDPADVAELVGDRPWLATNADVTVPTPGGPIPDTGAVIARVEPAVGRPPEVCGKPSDWMTAATSLVAGEIGDAVVIGDGVATDLAWARRRGWASVLIGSGGAAMGADVVLAGLRDCLV